MRDWREDSAARERSMAAAIKWREDRKRLEPGSACQRCAGTGLVTWFGHIGQGGQKAPCPKCQPLGAARFAEQHVRATWGDPRERRFIKAFTGGSDK